MEINNRNLLNYLLVGNFRREIGKKEKILKKFSKVINLNGSYMSYCKIENKERGNEGKRRVLYKVYLYGTSELDIMRKHSQLELEIKESFDDFKIYELNGKEKKEIFTYP